MTSDQPWNNVIFQRWNNVEVWLFLKVEIPSGFPPRNSIVFRLEWHCFNLVKTLFSGLNDFFSTLEQRCFQVKMTLLQCWYNIVFWLESGCFNFHKQPHSNIKITLEILAFYRCNPDLFSTLMYFSMFSMFFCTATTVSISLSGSDPRLSVLPGYVRLWCQYYE